MGQVGDVIAAILGHRSVTYAAREADKAAGGATPPHAARTGVGEPKLQYGTERDAQSGGGQGAAQGCHRDSGIDEGDPRHQDGEEEGEHNAREVNGTRSQEEKKMRKRLEDHHCHQKAEDSRDGTTTICEGGKDDRSGTTTTNEGEDSRLHRRRPAKSRTGSLRTAWILPKRSIRKAM